LAEQAGLTPKQISFVVGDALAPELPDATYDLVIAVESSTYMPDKE
jgi:ubiquinone/menaquinone biosynthesis C-methylase UbiE